MKKFFYNIFQFFNFIFNFSFEEQVKLEEQEFNKIPRKVKKKKSHVKTFDIGNKTIECTKQQIQDHFHGNKEKKRFETLKKAQKAALKMIEKHGINFVAYYCKICDGYHVGRDVKGLIGEKVSKPKDKLSAKNYANILKNKNKMPYTEELNELRKHFGIIK